MFITLISQEKIFSLRLPEKVGGKFWINDDEQPGKLGDMFAIEGDTQIDKWVIKNSRNIRFAGDQTHNIHNTGRVDDLILEADQLYPLKLTLAGKEENVFLLTEDVTEDRSHYHKFAINGSGTIKIGRNQDNGIIIDNPFVSGTHAALTFNKGNWNLEVNPKSNGTYVNRHIVIGNVQVYPGDAIFIMGVRGVHYGFVTSAPVMFMTLFVSILELLVAVIQAYVFTLLTVIFASLQLEAH